MRRIYGGVKRRKQSCRPPRGARCCIQGRRDRWRVGVESRRPRASAARSGTETVGYTEPCWVEWSKVANRSGGREGWVGKAHHSSAAPSSRANRGEGAKEGWAPIRGLHAAPCSRAAVALHITGAGGKGGGAPFLFRTKGGHAPLLLCAAIRSLVPTSLYVRSGARTVAHTPPFCIHISARRGERGGMRKKGWVGPSAEKRRAKAKREGRTEGEGIGAPHACGGVNAALTALSAARILEEEEGIGGLFVPPCRYTHCLCVIFTYLSLLKKV